MKLFAALALTISLATPALAGGTLTFNFEAKNGHQADALRAGLVLYQIARDIDTNGHISQRGINNMAALAQGGSGNIGVIHQDGSNHDATLTQTGGYNSCGVFQFGNGATSNVHQTGGE
ncbi:MAG: curlin, partial [Pseudomonadota bacterium]